MKLIIDIDENVYANIFRAREYLEKNPYNPEYLILNGVPCDDMFNIVKNACSIQKLSEERVEDIKREVWKLYEKHQSHLATHVIEFGDELKELLGKYQKGGAE